LKWSTAGVPDSLRAAAILGLVIVLMYGEISFFGYTLNPGLWNYGVLNVPQYGYKGRWLYYGPVMDPLATGGVMWPLYAMISRTLLSGEIPLWNPYQGIGAPLAADTTWATYYPINILYSISNQYWDFVCFLKLWLAGVLCYLFLRDLRLRFMPSLGGSFAYCLSGAFIFYPFTPWADVAILTPALLLSAKRCFDRPLSAGCLSIGSVVLAISILGAHIEALVIQFLFVNLFVLFEAIVIRRENRARGVASWVATVLLGFGLAAFFLLPVFEYLSLATLGHGGDVGVHSLSTDGNPVIWVLTMFVPYFFGFLQTYPYQGLRQVFFWDISPGYIGTSVFFLASVALFSIRMPLKRRSVSYSIFFIGASFLILLKIFGIPPVNWIGYLPVLSHVIFSRYSGSVLAVSFSGACAFGLESVLSGTSTVRSLRKAIVLPLLVITFGTLATVPVIAAPSVYMLPWLRLPVFIGSMAYLMLSMLFLFLSYIVASTGGTDAAKTLVVLIILELVCYIPMSLPVAYEAGRVAVCLGAAITVVLYSRRFRLPVVSMMARRILPLEKLSIEHVCALMLVTALILQSGVAAISPAGLPNRYDAFTEAPYLTFLKQNIGDQRVYSLDGVLFPPVAGVFSIQHLGEFTAFMPHSFRTFSQTNLDRGAVFSTLVGNAWARIETISPSTEIRDNLEFYSLLGVKYFVTKYTDLCIAHEIVLQPEIEGTHSWAPLGNNSVSTQFVTDKPFDGITMRIGTYDRVNIGEVALVLDSVPHNATFHRESRINAESVANGAPNMFTFAEIRVTDKTEFRITLSQSDTRPGNEVAVMWWPQVKQNPHLVISGGFLNVALGIVLHDQFLPVVYHDQNVTIYQNLRAFPRAFLVNHVVVIAENGEEAVLKTRDLGWSTRSTLVVEGTSSAQVVQINASTAKSTVDSVEIERYSPSEVAIRVEASGPSFLVLTDIFYPGWGVYVDGKPMIIYRAYGVVRAVFVEAGHHDVLFVYEPNSFRLGSVVTIMSALIIASLIVKRVSLTVRRKIRLFRESRISAERKV